MSCARLPCFVFFIWEALNVADVLITHHTSAVWDPLLHPQGFMSPNHRVLDLAHWDTQELSKLWLLHSPDMESSRGHREGREEKGKKGLIVQQRRVGNFTGRPEQSLEETQALSMAPLPRG